MNQTQKGTDLSSIFSQVTQVLAANQSSLNQADVENRNHGDNMVQTFNMISKALASQRGAPPSQQLQHASNYLSQNTKSGSGQIYAQGLARAAQLMQGQSAVTPEYAMTLIQSLLGGGQQTQQSQGLNLSDVLGAGMTFMNAKQQGEDNLHAALKAVLSNGPLGQTPHRQQSGQIVGNTLQYAIAGLPRR